jgi:hypothetical protein
LDRSRIARSGTRVINAAFRHLIVIKKSGIKPRPGQTVWSKLALVVTPAGKVKNIAQIDFPSAISPTTLCGGHQKL